MLQKVVTFFDKHNFFDLFLTFFVLLVGVLSILFSDWWQCPILFWIGIFLLILSILTKILFCYLPGKKRRNRTYEDYVRQYQKYVDHVDQIANQSGFLGHITLPEDWIMLFDKYLPKVAERCVDCNVRFSDFAIAACLMYALTAKNLDSLQVRFAFECTKLFISEPQVYKAYFGYGGTLHLDKTLSPFKKVGIYAFQPYTNSEEVITIFKAYLSERNPYTDIYSLSDFLMYLYATIAEPKK